MFEIVEVFKEKKEGNEQATILYPQEINDAYWRLVETGTFSTVEDWVMPDQREPIQHPIFIQTIITRRQLERYVQQANTICMPGKLEKEPLGYTLKQLNDIGSLYLGFYEMQEAGTKLWGHIQLCAAINLEQQETLIFDDIASDNTGPYFQLTTKAIAASYLKRIVPNKCHAYVQTPGSATKPAEVKSFFKIGTRHNHHNPFIDAFYHGNTLLKTGNRPARKFLNIAHVVQ